MARTKAVGREIKARIAREKAATEQKKQAKRTEQKAKGTAKKQLAVRSGKYPTQVRVGVSMGS